ncbi:prephenate dehydrogenase [Luteimonas saliphila]|uniref:prephenate dehydrogenase n=1 Tax=Luteimonas saliphila TaxID=2804919 RepID=UPI00192DB45D
MTPSPLIGIVGSAGTYGRWLRGFFERRMGLQVIGHDPGDAGGQTPEALLERADVLLFATPIRSTAALVDEYVRLSAGREAGRLWLDITSIKQGAVEAMLRSRAEVVGLHPMTAPPKAPTLKGRVLVVCEARVDRWRPWLQGLLEALEGECVHAGAERHDRMMALVQAMVHASHLAQAGVLGEYAERVGGLASIMPFRSASFELDAAIAARILSLNPAIYEEIQFGNRHSAEVLDSLLAQLSELRDLVRQGDDAARARFRERFLHSREAFGEQALAEGNHAYERLGYLLADLVARQFTSVHLPQDRPGSLRELLHVFESHRVSLESIHSSRTPAGEVHFRIGFVRGTDPAALAAAVAQIDATGIGRVLESG